MEIFIASIIWGIIWGYVCKRVARNKGIEGELWFIWGFLFNFFALIIVATKPYNNAGVQDTYSNSNIINNPIGVIEMGWECTKCRHYNNSSSVVCICGEPRPVHKIKSSQQVVKGWKCRFCGRINAEYVGTCGCGKTKTESALWKSNTVETIPRIEEVRPSVEEVKSSIKEVKPKSEEAKIKSQIENLELLKKYKELLDIGAITQEEFDNKKKEIIG